MDGPIRLSITALEDGSVNCDLSQRLSKFDGDQGTSSLQRRLPRPTNPRQNSVTARFRVALCAEVLQAFCRHLNILAHANHVSSAKRRNAEHHSERK
jgi:hypothetical protein